MAHNIRQEIQIVLSRVKVVFGKPWDILPIPINASFVQGELVFTHTHTHIFNHNTHTIRFLNPFYLSNKKSIPGKLQVLGESSDTTFSHDDLSKFSECRLLHYALFATCSVSAEQANTELDTEDKVLCKIILIKAALATIIYKS